MMKAMELSSFQLFMIRKPGFVNSFTEFFISFLNAFPNDNFKGLVYSQTIQDFYTDYTQCISPRGVKMMNSFHFGHHLLRWCKCWCCFFVDQEKMTGICICHQNDQFIHSFSAYMIMFIINDICL